MIGLWLLLGFAGAAVYIAAGRTRGADWWAVGLMVAALAYVAFAVSHGAPVGGIGLEVVGGRSAPAWYVWACLSFVLAVGAWWVRRSALETSTTHV